MANTKIGGVVIVIVLSFCIIAVLSRYVGAGPTIIKQDRMKVTVRPEYQEPEGGVELQLLQRDDKRYTVYRAIDEPQTVERVLIILKQADWREAKPQMIREPDYKIETIRADEPLTYAVWVTPRRNIELIIEGKSKYVRLDDRASRTLLTLLEYPYEPRWNGQYDNQIEG